MKMPESSLAAFTTNRKNSLFGPPDIYERYFIRVDLILDFLENFRQCFVIATKRNEQHFRIPSQMHQTILFRLSNLIPVDMNDMESDLALVG